MNDIGIIEVEILLVEDNPDDRLLTLRALAKAKVANPVYAVKDGEEAIDFLFAQGMYAGRAAARAPKVVLLDLHLPKMDGFEVLSSIRRDDRTKNIPVVVLTSSRENRDLSEAYKLGANSYIVKPVEFNKFMESVSELGYYWTLLNEQPS